MADELVIRNPDGTRKREATTIAEPQPLSAQERADAAKIVWEITEGEDTRRRQRPTGSAEALAAYRKANPFSARMFELAERIETSPGRWDWIMPDGSTVDGFSRNVEEERVR